MKCPHCKGFGIVTGWTKGKDPETLESIDITKYYCPICEKHYEEVKKR